LADVKLIAIILCSYFIFSGESIANQNAVSEKLQVHGFIAQGLIDVNGSNYVNDDESLSFELTEIGVNASYQLSSDVRIAGQTVYLNGGNRYNEGIRLDYLLLDWSLFNDDHWKTNLYLGRIKNYHWLYSSTRDVPMTRPSIILPQSVYFDATRDMSIGGDGGAITTRYSSERFGDLDLNASIGISQISSKLTNIIMGDLSTGSMTHDKDFQASIYWRPNLSQWRFGVATTNADFTYHMGENDVFQMGLLELERYYASAVYEEENWTFSAEIVQEQKLIKGFMFPGFVNDTTGQGGFVQTRYRLTPKTQLLGRYERYYNDKNDKNGRMLEKNSFGTIPRYFGYQNDITIGLNYDLSSSMQVQFEYHYIKGTARLTPVLIPDPASNLKENWQVWALQMMYWF
jgi:hypothetical protein